MKFNTTLLNSKDMSFFMWKGYSIFLALFFSLTSPVEAKSLTIIGDSITIKAKPYIEQIVPKSSVIVIDAKKGRKFQELRERINFLEQRTLLKDTIIIALGTNGPFTLEEALNISDYLLSLNKKIYFVNIKVPRKWEDEVNNTLKALKELRQEISLIEWNPAYQKLCYNVACFRDDGYHLTDEGALIYANFIINSIHD